MKSFLFVLTALSLTACVSLPKEQCANPNWENIGRVDAAEGFTTDTYDVHVKSCERIPDPEEKAQYTKGWTEGLAKFCTAQNGYNFGRRGIRKDLSCDATKYPEFAEQFKLGLQIYEMDASRKITDERIQREQEDGGFLNQLNRSFILLGGQDPEGDLKKHSRDLNAKISEVETEAAIKRGTPVDTFSLRTDASTQRATNYLGAMFGTVMGFGLGHVVQGRWMDDGWKWTAGEVLTLGAMIATAERCEDHAEYLTGKIESKCEAGNPWTIVAWLGFRVWQAYDLWSYANKSSNIYAFPTKDGLTVGYRF